MSLIFAGGWGWRRNLRRHALIQSSGVHTNTSQRFACIFICACAAARPKFTFGSVKSLSLSLSLLCKQPNRFLRLEHIFIMFRRHTIQLYSLAAECVIWPAALVGPFHCCERATEREPTMRSALREATSSAVMPKS